MKQAPIITLNKTELEERSATEAAIIDISGDGKKSRFWVTVKIERGRPKILLTTRVGSKETHTTLTGSLNIDTLKE